jgi:hypothetical protein
LLWVRLPPARQGSKEWMVAERRLLPELRRLQQPGPRLALEQPFGQPSSFAF